jgi:hypothetical protein
MVITVTLVLLILLVILTIQVTVVRFLFGWVSGKRVIPGNIILSLLRVAGNHSKTADLQTSMAAAGGATGAWDGFAQRQCDSLLRCCWMRSISKAIYSCVNVGSQDHSKPTLAVVTTKSEAISKMALEGPWVLYWYVCLPFCAFSVVRWTWGTIRML